MKFKKIVAVDNIAFTEDRYGELFNFAHEVDTYRDFPTDNGEIIKRIGNADCVLVSWNTKIGKDIIESCPSIKYIGMCCSLYDEKSANVDIATAREKGITVLGVRDYGDQGVVEYVTTELIDLLHGFEREQWKADQILEITGTKVGIIGLGTTGSMVAATLQMFGADVYYNDMTRKPEAEARGIRYMELPELLKTVDVLTTHLPKNLHLLDKAKLAEFGNGKIIINPSIGPTYVVEDMLEWLGNKENFLLSEKSSMNDILPRFINLPNFVYTDRVVGMTEQAKQRLIVKVLNNMTTFLEGQKA